VVDQSSQFYYNWIAVVSICILYNCIMIIARSVFTELQERYYIPWLSLDYISDFIYIMDMIVQVRTGE
jgi:hypothetical protein